MKVSTSCRNGTSIQEQVITANCQLPSPSSSCMTSWASLMKTKRSCPSFNRSILDPQNEQIRTIINLHKNRKIFRNLGRKRQSRMRFKKRSGSKMQLLNCMNKILKRLKAFSIDKCQRGWPRQPLWAHRKAGQRLLITWSKTTLLKFELKIKIYV